LVSPEVHADRTVTFRFRSTSSGPVLLSLEGSPTSIAMTPSDGNVWEATVGPLDPEYYGYSFRVDDQTLVDPGNSLLKPNVREVTSMVHVPGPSYLPWETNNIPHGEVHHHFYHSGIVGDDRDYYVYTPPGYETSGDRRYPVLYLLHGFSDDASGWTSIGLANVILDNLIATHQARPMLVVMPLGYGLPAIVARHRVEPEPDPLRGANYEKFGETLLDEVLPQVEAEYRVVPDREHRAIAGLSMGGAESLLVGLNHLDTFAYVGSFSAGHFAADLPTSFPKVTSAINDQLRLLWVACGTEDGLLGNSRRLRAWLAQQGVAHVDIETPGMHCWLVWRSNLAAFAPLLFTH
jgi:enterochelin esterase family protein